jgi:hypothetical protein
MIEQLKKIDKALTKIRYKGIEFETNQKDILLLTFLCQNQMFLEMERLYGKEFTDAFYEAVYPENAFL